MDTAAVVCDTPTCVSYRSESKLAALKEHLASEIDPAASTLPTILADCQDDEAVERMVSQAKVRNKGIDTSAGAVLRET